MATFGIRVINSSNVGKFTFESTDMKARAKVYELSRVEKNGIVQLFKCGYDGFEYVGCIARASNLFEDSTGRKWIINPRGKLEKFNRTITPMGGIVSVPSWY